MTRVCRLKILEFLSIWKIDKSSYLWEIFVLSKAEQTRPSVEALLFCGYESKFAGHVQNDFCYSMTTHGIGITMIVFYCCFWHKILTSAQPSKKNTNSMLRWSETWRMRPKWDKSISFHWPPHVQSIYLPPYSREIQQSTSIRTLGK